LYGEERIFKRRRSRPEPSPGPLRDGERREVLPPPWIREATQTFGLILPKVSSAFLQREAPVGPVARKTPHELKAHSLKPLCLCRQRMLDNEIKRRGIRLCVSSLMAALLLGNIPLAVVHTLWQDFFYKSFARINRDADSSPNNMASLR
jgi:hypothetical protein